jgi:DNA-binding PadR family transcriptional regulator
MYNEAFPQQHRGGHGSRGRRGRGRYRADPYYGGADPLAGGWHARGSRRGGSRLALLALLKDGPRTAAQLSQALAEHGLGRLLLTPGLLTMTLQHLQAVGLVRETDGSYELTETGTSYLNQAGTLPAGLGDQGGPALRQAIIATAAAVRQVARDGGQDEAAQATALLNETRRKLYLLLAGDAE